MHDREHMGFPPAPRGTKYVRHKHASAGDFPVAAVPVIDKGGRYEVVKRKRDTDAYAVYFADGSVAGVIDADTFSTQRIRGGKLSIFLDKHPSFDSALRYLGSWEAHRRGNPSSREHARLLNPWGTK